MFGLKRKKEVREKSEESDTDPSEACAEAEELHRRTLSELNKGLVVKREVREKTAQFVGALRPLIKVR